MCLIGIGSCVLNDCRIGEGCIIAAGSFFPSILSFRRAPSGAGVPAKLRREISDKDRELIREYAQNYLDYVEIYLKNPPQIL